MCFIFMSNPVRERVFGEKEEFGGGGGGRAVYAGVGVGGKGGTTFKKKF